MPSEADKNVAKAPDTACALDAIDFEIESAKREMSRPGWSPWAFGTATAAAAWALLDLLEGGLLWTQGTLQLSIYLLFGAEVLRRIWQTWSAGRGARESVRTFFSAHDLRRRKPAMLFSALTWIAAAVLHAASDATVPLWMWWVTTVTLALLAVLLCAILWLMLTDLPVPIAREPSSRFNRTLALASLACLLWTSFLAASTIEKLPGGEYTPLRAALLCLSLVWLIEGFLSQPSKVPLLRDLEELRRDVVLAGLAPADALEQVRVLVRGAAILDVVSSLAMECLRALAMSLDELQAAKSELASLKSLIDQASGPLSEEERALGSGVMQAQKHRVDSASKARLLAKGKFETLVRKLGQIRRRPSEDAVAEQVKAVLVQRDAQLDDVEAERTALIGAVEDSVKSRGIVQAPGGGGDAGPSGSSGA